MACDLPGSEGRCAYIPAGTNPDRECSIIERCDGVGACKVIGGAPCATAEQCMSGHCTDGVCCDAPECPGACRSCAVPGKEGRCAFYAEGVDPEEDCEGVAICDGEGGCHQLGGNPCASDGDCRSGFCTDGVCCDGPCDGTCESCALFGYEGQCQLIASGEDPEQECPQGAVCNGAGACQSTVGSPCTSYADCLLYKEDDGSWSGGYCVDGVCCDTACDGGCVACNLGAAVGTCTPLPAGVDPQSDCGPCSLCSGSFTDAVSRKGAGCVPVAAGMDPDGDCVEMAPETCSTTGLCDGKGACAYHPEGVLCGEENGCRGSTAIREDLCDGKGSCRVGGATECGAYACDPVTATCIKTCDGHEDCFEDYYCAPPQCVLAKIEGESCREDIECFSGHCVDGVCCDTACEGTCRMCNHESSRGSCTDVPPGQDPDRDCGVCHFCDGTGSCAFVGAGADPLRDCDATAAERCGLDGECDGAGSCRHWVDGTVCGSPSCVGTTYYRKDRCNGSGQCTDRGSETCGSGFVCNDAGTACRQACTHDGHCQEGWYCDGNDRKCKLKNDPGVSCTGANQCKSGYCADGVCCNVPCTAVCRSCALAGHVGTCTNYAKGRDPEGNCAGACKSCNGAGACEATAAGTTSADDPELCVKTAASACGHNGVCDGAGTCAFWPSGTTCANQSCSGDQLTPARSCNGAGTCSPATPVSCGGYKCEGASCRTSCAKHWHCADTHYCDGANKCVPRLGQGAGCSFHEQCAANLYCTDFVCCDEPCDGACWHCNLAGSVGVCTQETVEVCDGKDNNCVNGIDEEGAVGCSDYFVDRDRDGYYDEARKGTPRCLCAPETGWSNVAGDCCDRDDWGADIARAIHPNQPDYRDWEINDAICPVGYDHNCDGVIELRYPEPGSCTRDQDSNCIHKKGYHQDDLPGCGGWAWRIDSCWWRRCEPRYTIFQKQQRCR